MFPFVATDHPDTAFVIAIVLMIEVSFVDPIATK